MCSVLALVVVAVFFECILDVRLCEEREWDFFFVFSFLRVCFAVCVCYFSVACRLVLGTRFIL